MLIYLSLSCTVQASTRRMSAISFEFCKSKCWCCTQRSAPTIQASVAKLNISKVFAVGCRGSRGAAALRNGAPALWLIGKFEKN